MSCLKSMASNLTAPGQLVAWPATPVTSARPLSCARQIHLCRHKTRHPISLCKSAGSAYNEPEKAKGPDADPVQAALQKVNDAVYTAEQQLDKLDQLPSNRLPRQVHPYLQLTVKVLIGILAFTAAYQSQLYALWLQFIGAGVTAVLVAAYGFSRSSLSSTGALAAMFVGASSFACSWRMGITLLAFFGASSRLTQFKEEQKQVDESHRSGGQRDWQQVFCNALVPSLLAIAFGLLTGCKDVPLNSQNARKTTAVMGAYLGYYACCCADTWASELGQLSEQQPRLITTLRRVRKGTNGGVTLIGLAASLAGGAFMGLVFWSMGAISPRLYTVPYQQEPALGQWSLVFLGASAGLVGSLIDSLLGATVQFTGFNVKTKKVTSKYSEDVAPISGMPLLTNNLVNLLSASLVAVGTAWAVLKFY